VYKSVLEDRHQCSVRSSLVLLSDKANLKVYTGRYESVLQGEAEPYRTFRYDVVRLWEMEPATFLNGDVTLLPLVPLTKVTPEAMPEVFGEMVRRIDPEADPTKFNVLRSATDILMKLRYDDEFITRLLETLPVEHSAWWKALEARSEASGELKGQKKLLRDLGQARFGPPPEATLRTLNSLSDVKEVEKIALRLFTASSWEELLPTTGKKPTKRKRAK
jgi:hypothetical protein